MRRERHPTREMLMDFVDEDLSSPEAGEIESHLAECALCRGYVESLKRTLGVLAADCVPEPADTYFTYLAGRARQRSRSGRRRFVLGFVPGLAAATAVVFLMWWLAATPVSPVDSVDVILAEMTTGQIVEAVSDDPLAEGLLGRVSGAGLEEIDAYLEKTESIFGLFHNMSDAEKARFAAYLEGSMRDDSETSDLTVDSAWKEC